MRITDVLCAAVLGASAAAGLGCSTPSGGAASGHHRDDPNRCATCHMPDYLATKKPMHPGAKPTTCGVCHASTSWHPSHLDHPFWALTGAHEKTTCFDCHRGTPPAFKGTSKVCVDCHRADFDGAKFPGHSTFALTCANCHTTTAWKPATSPAPPTAGKR